MTALAIVFALGWLITAAAAIRFREQRDWAEAQVNSRRWGPWL